MTSQLKVDRISPATGSEIIIDGLDIPEPPEPTEPEIKAWVRFQGVENPPRIVCSKGVSSITDRGVGQYTVNFTNPFEDRGKISALCTPGAQSTARKDAFVGSITEGYVDIEAKASDILDDMNGVTVWVTEELA